MMILKMREGRRLIYASVASKSKSGIFGFGSPSPIQIPKQFSLYQRYYKNRPL